MTPFAPLARRRPRAHREGLGRPGPGGLIRGCLIFTLRALCIKAFASGRRGASTGAFTDDTPSADRAQGRGPAPPDPAGRPDGHSPGLARRTSGRDSGRAAAAWAEARGPVPEGSEGRRAPRAVVPGAQLGQRWGTLVCRPCPSAGLIYSRVCPSLMFAQREEERGRASRVPPHRAGPAPRPSWQSPRPRRGSAPPFVRACVRPAVCLF